MCTRVASSQRVRWNWDSRRIRRSNTRQFENAFETESDAGRRGFWPCCTSGQPSRGRWSCSQNEVHISRATLARRFAEVVGEPPLTYLARWRMHLAAQRLKYTTDTVEAIAREVGYTSEYAFNRAFARHRGQPPDRYRRHASS